MSILELLQHIVNEPAPRLQPEGKFPTLAVEFVDACLLKDPEARPTPKDLLVSRTISPIICPVLIRLFAETPMDRRVEDKLDRFGNLGVHCLSLDS